jgi:hypothetical protein
VQQSDSRLAVDINPLIVTALRKSNEMPCSATAVKMRLTFPMPVLSVETLVANIKKNEYGIGKSYITFALTCVKYTSAYKEVIAKQKKNGHRRTSQQDST